MRTSTTARSKRSATRFSPGSPTSASPAKVIRFPKAAARRAADGRRQPPLDQRGRGRRPAHRPARRPARAHRAAADTPPGAHGHLDRAERARPRPAFVPVSAPADDGLLGEIDSPCSSGAAAELRALDELTLIDDPR